MKIANGLIVIAVCILLCKNGHAQGFVDLNFESANLSGYSAGAVPTSDAIPGWTVTDNYLGPNEILYNSISIGAPSVSIFGANGVYPVLDGAYSIDLYGGASLATGVSISQTGLVPANSLSISFIALGFAGSTLQVTLGGQNISFSAISTEANYSTYGENIPSAFAGQSEQLAFTTPEAGGNNYWEIDDIQFSASPVPEPNSSGLFVLGGLLVAWLHWRKPLPKVSPWKGSGLSLVCFRLYKFGEMLGNGGNAASITN